MTASKQIPLSMDVLEPISNLTRKSAGTRERWVCDPDRYHFTFQTISGKPRGVNTKAPANILHGTEA